VTAPRSQPIPAGRVAGVDYGRRRIGIAVCDVARILASPLCVHLTTGDRTADATFFRRLAAAESWLSRTTDRPVAFHDERYSSREAAGLLAGVGLTRGRKKERADAVAAQVVLASWLESRRLDAAESAPGPLE